MHLWGTPWQSWNDPFMMVNKLKTSASHPPAVAGLRVCASWTQPAAWKTPGCAMGLSEILFPSLMDRLLNIQWFTSSFATITAHTLSLCLFYCFMIHAIWLPNWHYWNEVSMLQPFLPPLSPFSLTVYRLERSFSNHGNIFMFCWQKVNLGISQTGFRKNICLFSKGMCAGDQIYEGEIESGYLKDSEIKASHPLTRGRTILINCFRLKQNVKIN